ncbi:putative P450 monooxygenase [Myriangium duriaei CBS 260.36]|uniref:P450 monooxygenase n=1 Tax=Myriangium duriaei CBS 260.36 TaxID=1168546 RepID=A0A9P4MJD3_9PEZI|nr:putative P450 monooxygenase [Myriangium duriaei CBS 260.36]
MHGSAYLNSFLISCAGSCLALSRLCGLEAGEAARITSAIAASFLFGAFGSMMIWRIYFNPLNSLPGPWAARLSSLYWTSKLTKSDAHYQLLALHKIYGRVVRIGSNDLSITDPNIMDVAYGKHSRVTKGWWYDGDAPMTSMHTTRDKALHDKRRKVWVPAFSEKAVRDYESRIVPLSDLLIKKIGETESAPTNITLLFNLFTFDTMALLAFGRDYGMLERGEKHYALKLLGDGMQPLAFWFPSWLIRMLISIPGAMVGYQKFVKFCIDELSWRVNNAQEAESKGGIDIMSWILRAYKDIDRPDKDPMLQADARLIIVAGSDTTAAALTYLFYHLAKDPEQAQTLRAELTPLTRGQWTDKDINQAPHLNGCIYEALRLHPPVPSGVQRLTPPEGMVADGRAIPGSTIFWMPQAVMGRDEEIYNNANSFVPERWYSKSEMVKHPDAWAPFSAGPMGCIGKSLAMMELRMVVAKLITKFDVRLAPDEDGTRLLYHTKDHFTVELGDLDLVFNSF